MTQIIGLCFCTGTRFIEVSESGGLNKQVAYVWENGDIDWKENESSYVQEELLPIYKCAAQNKNKLQDKRKLLQQLEEEYPSLRKGTLKELNVSHYIWHLREEIEDLLKYKTTCVIH